MQSNSDTKVFSIANIRYTPLTDVHIEYEKYAFTITAKVSDTNYYICITNESEYRSSFTYSSDRPFCIAHVDADNIKVYEDDILVYSD